MLQTSVTFAWVGADPKVRVDETAVGSKKYPCPVRTVMWSLQKQEETCSLQLGFDKCHAVPYKSRTGGQSQAGQQ